MHNAGLFKTSQRANEDLIEYSRRETLVIIRQWVNGAEIRPVQRGYHGRDERGMRSTRSSVICWWETGATSLPRELPTWSLLTTPSQGISWLNRPHTRLTHTRARAPNRQILTRSSFITEPGLWAWIKDSDPCFVMLAELTKGRTSGPGAQKRSMVRRGKKKKKSLMWDVFNVHESSKYGKALSQLFSCCGRARQRALACVRASLTSARGLSSLYWIKLKYLWDGFSMNLFPEEVVAYQVTFSLVVPMLTFKGLPLKCLNNY